MANSRKSNSRTGGMEENMMAILDSSGIKEARDFHDDRLAFLEAVRAAYLVSDSGAPSSKIFEAVFHILKDTASLELIMMSYQLLIELDKHFPRVNCSHPNTVEPSCSGTIELVLGEEAWSPFSLGPASTYNERGDSYRNSGNLFDSLGFSDLIESIAKQLEKMNGLVPGMKLVADMMLFQYLVNVLEQDFLSRSVVYNEIKNWCLLRESIVNLLLGSRRITYKGLMKSCVSILSKEYNHTAGVTLSNLGNEDVALYISYFELKKATYMCMQKFLSLIMELDIIKKKADMLGQTSRADGVRAPLLEIILDEFTYDDELFSQFLQVFSDPKWKLEIILLYFSKYSIKPSVRTRRSSSSSEDATLNEVLNYFSSETSTKSIMKKLSTDAAQLLLAHAFLAYLKLQRLNEHIADSIEDIRDGSTLKICKDIITAFHNLRKADKGMEMMPIGKEALFTATTIISMKS